MQIIAHVNGICPGEQEVRKLFREENEEDKEEALDED
jgi:hypothetical protein